MDYISKNKVYSWSHQPERCIFKLKRNGLISFGKLRIDHLPFSGIALLPFLVECRGTRNACSQNLLKKRCQKSFGTRFTLRWRKRFRDDSSSEEEDLDSQDLVQCPRVRTAATDGLIRLNNQNVKTLTMNGVQIEFPFEPCTYELIVGRDAWKAYAVCRSG